MAASLPHRPGRTLRGTVCLAGALTLLTGCLPEPATQAAAEAVASDATFDTGSSDAAGAELDATGADAFTLDASPDMGADMGPTADAGPPPVSRPGPCTTGATGPIGPEGGSLEVVGDTGLRDAALLILPGVLEEIASLSIECAPDFVPEGYVALGPAARVGAAAPTRLLDTARVTLVFDAATLPEGIEASNLRLFWQPERFGYLSEPPLIDPLIDLREGTVSFETPGLGGFQLGYEARAGEPIERRYTFRAIAGISMGGGAAAFLGPTYAELFDFVVPMGGPLDWRYLMHYVLGSVTAGFCTAADAEGPGGFCATDYVPTPFEHTATYPNLYYSNNADFDRSGYLDLFHDISYAYGNPISHNPDSPYAAAGLPLDELRRSPGARCAAECRGDNCPPAEPFTIATGYFDDEFNPDGELPVIAYCDGEDGAPNGVFDDTVAHRMPVDMMLAVDVNGNGRRDADEPIIRSSHEPWRDVGCDGIPSTEEAGYDPELNPDPAGDDYDWYRNPTGLEGNWAREGAADCGGNGAEPFDDVGLDGVPGTPQYPEGFDTGEGNGEFDMAPGYRRVLEKTGGRIYRALSAEQRHRLQFWIDAGRRDFFNFAEASNHLVGQIQSTGENVRIYDTFSPLIRNNTGSFFPAADAADLFQDRGRHIYVRYGNKVPTSDADGEHVGDARQVLNRFFTMFDWLHNRWPDGDYEGIDPPYSSESAIEYFESERFGKTYHYAVALPPGYAEPENAERRYPVLFFLHGYGQAPEDLPITGAILANAMAAGYWQKSIVVFPEGFCGKSTVYQCNDGIDNDGDGAVDSGRDADLRIECTDDDGVCRAGYSCRANTAEPDRSWCCPPEMIDCGPPDEACGRNQRGRNEAGGNLALCADGVDNDRDGRVDLEDEGCTDAPGRDSEADCISGSFFTTHQAQRDGTAGGPDFEGALLDMVGHVDRNYRTRQPEVISERR